MLCSDRSAEISMSINVETITCDFQTGCSSSYVDYIFLIVSTVLSSPVKECFFIILIFSLYMTM
jgi:hypothetical protein